MSSSIVITLVFLFQLLLSEAVFLVKSPPREKFLPRCLFALSGYAAAALTLNAVFNQLPQTVLFRLAFFLLFLAFSVLAILFCFRMGLSQAVFVAIAGYSLEHIIDSLVKILMVYTDVEKLPMLAFVGILLTIYLLLLSHAYFLLVRLSRIEEQMRQCNRTVLAVSGLNLILCLVLSVLLDRYSADGPTMVICKVYAIFGCGLCLALQVGLFRQSKMEKTNKELQQMMEIERRQHLISKETIELINIKCHDMKHQIDKLATQSEEKRSRNIAELSQAILIYDSMIKTGSEALDMVLMEKKLLCEKYQIHFSFLGDGSVLNFMEETDIYSLFGNMMDNAIESLQLEPDPEKRVVSLRINHRSGMIYICMDNYFSTPLRYEDGVMQTTKQHEAGMHGYGIKSISYIVNCYRGDLVITTENSHFVLEMLLPEPVPVPMK